MRIKFLKTVGSWKKGYEATVVNTKTNTYGIAMFLIDGSIIQVPDVTYFEEIKDEDKNIENKF